MDIELALFQGNTSLVIFRIKKPETVGKMRNTEQNEVASPTGSLMKKPNMRNQGPANVEQGKHVPYKMHHFFCRGM